MLFRGRRFANGTKILRAVNPNIGVETAYRRKLDSMIEAMHDSIMYFVLASYKKNEPEIAQDAVPADELKRAVTKLVDRWTRNFDDTAEQMAEHFSQDISERSDAALRSILKKGGWSVKFKMTASQRDIFKSTVNQNVALIKSIPQQYLSGVEQLVQESVQSGRDLGALSKSLQEKYGVTKRRAALISRDQNNKATSAFNRARQTELGIKQAIWMHSHAGEVPRPTHVKMDGETYDISKGMWDPAVKEWIQPGQLINCRCTSRPIVPGFT